ncbi:hypothetical protein MMC30_008000 [Trapelia coarctata]|nr:hypothetical protein [Trapelia coarctata]
MASFKAGDSFPEGVVFSYVPYTPEKEEITACGIPINYDASKEWADKKVVLFSVPGAFTPGCSVRHLPGYIENLQKIKSKGVDVVAVIAFNDAWVMSAWSKANGIKNDDIVRLMLSSSFARGQSRWRTPRFVHQEAMHLILILFLSDIGAKFSQSIGWTKGERTARYAIVIDHGKVTYAELEPAGDVTVSGAEAVLAKL